MGIKNNLQKKKRILYVRKKTFEKYNKIKMIGKG
jgi:hypothetical protein